jgi:hypothetical protein
MGRAQECDLQHKGDDHNTTSESLSEARSPTRLTRLPAQASTQRYSD